MRKKLIDMDNNSQELREEVLRQYKEIRENPVDMTKINEKFNKTSTISLRVSKYERDKIEECAKEWCLNNSELVMMALREFGVDF